MCAGNRVASYNPQLTVFGPQSQCVSHISLTYMLKRPHNAYFMPGTIPSTLQVLTYSVSPQPQEGGSNTVPILQMGTLRHIEVK